MRISSSLSLHVALLAIGGAFLLPSAVSAASTCAFTSGQLVKATGDVYYYGSDCTRHAFADQSVFASWYPNTENINPISIEEMASMSLGKNVTYRPGLRLVQFETVPGVYAVARGGVLRKVTTDAIAASLYGADWQTKVDHISDAYYVDYSFGKDITLLGEFDPMAEAASASTIEGAMN